MQQVARSEEGQAGFSLIELMVAMTITLVISGAVYGLVSGGQNAFRREPELSERQQNIRVAMDMILRDVANAGSGMPPFVQTFTPNLNDCAPCPQSPDLAGQNADELEILTNAGLRDNEAVCRTDGNLRANGANDLQLVRANTDITAGTSLVLVMDDGTYTVRSVTAVGAAAAPETNCAAVNHALLTFAPGDPQAMNPGPATLCSPNVQGIGTAVAGCDVMEVAYGEVVRYRLRVGADGVPVLQRATSANPGAGFQTIARGIDDFQVQYITAGLDPTVAANWVNAAPVVGLPAAANWASIISQVRVTLSARSEAPNIAGVRTSVTGPQAMRGALTATASPRSSLMALTRADPAVAPLLWR